MRAWDFIRRLRRRVTGPPVILTEYGPVTESARLRAALNMREDVELRAKIIAMLGEAKARKHYPEAFE